MLLVGGLQRFLRRRQRRADGVVDQVQDPAAAGQAVAQRIELAQTGQAGFEDAVAALAVDVLFQVAG